MTDSFDRRNDVSPVSVRGPYPVAVVIKSSCPSIPRSETEICSSSLKRVPGEGTFFPEISGLYL
ncbi:MAG: hypothetical protein Q8R70_10170, partial [Methanoregula sp.]|nr:hypothetical protein [Methanoregula sp.]